MIIRKKYVRVCCFLPIHLIAQWTHQFCFVLVSVSDKMCNLKTSLDHLSNDFRWLSNRDSATARKQKYKNFSNLARKYFWWWWSRGGVAFNLILLLCLHDAPARHRRHWAETDPTGLTVQVYTRHKRGRTFKVWGRAAPEQDDLRQQPHFSKHWLKVSNPYLKSATG